MVQMPDVRTLIDWRWWLTVAAVSLGAAGAGFALGMWLGR